MRTANLCFTFSMAVYFTVSSYISFIWSEYYYTNVFGYIVLVVYANKTTARDRTYAKRVSISMWIIYILKSIFVGQTFVEWIRFFYGILLFFALIIYYFQTRHES